MDSKSITILLVLLAASSLLLVTGPHSGKGQTLTPHAPIYIACTVGFPTCQSTQYENWTKSDAVRRGIGTPNDPYIISDWEIITNSTFGIHIRNTSSFFIIRNVLIQRTNFTGESEGIFLDNVQNGQVENTNITNFVYGIWISLGFNNFVKTSNMWNNTYGIYMAGNNGIASGNHLFNNKKYGAYVTTPLNTVTGNNASANGDLIDGAGIFATSSNNIFVNNTLADNTWFGIKIVGSPLSAASNNRIINNTVLRNGNFTGGGGIVFAENCTRNLIMGNYVTKQADAVGLENVDEIPNSYNNITRNYVLQSDSGIYLYNSPYNTIYDNYLNNTANAIDNTALNSWNVTRRLQTNILGGPFVGGNFYAGASSGYRGTDADGDGIGDTPYNITQGQGQDQLPLAIVHDIAVQSVVAQPATARVGARISISVGVFNRGTVTESFSVSATYAPQATPQPIVIFPIQVTTVSANSGKTITISWDTTGLAVGPYFVQANASIVTGESATANNACCTTPPLVNLSINQPPVALIIVNDTSPLAGKTVTLNATQSYDPDGTVSSYSWSFGDATSPVNSAIAQHSWTLAGNYTVTLTVTDNEGGSSSNTTTLLVIYHQPSAPVNFELSATSGKATLTWTAPGDNGGSPILRYRIYRGLSNSTLVWIANTTGTTYDDKTVSIGLTYYYKVTAVNQAGLESPLSDSVPQNVLVPTTARGSSDNLLFLLAIILGVAVVAAVTGFMLIRRRQNNMRV